MRQNDFDRNQFVAVFRQLFDGNRANVCVLQLDGEILAVNRAWREFGVENGLAADYRFEGRNYLDVCGLAASDGDESARQALVGLLDVMHTGRSNFVLSYPCHAPHERRWFKMWVEPQMPSAPVIVIAHVIDSVKPGDDVRAISEAERAATRA